MFLERGWKTFARWCKLQTRHNILFRYDGNDTLWVKVFDSDGDRVECCRESSSSDNESLHEEDGSQSEESRSPPSSNDNGGGDSYSSYEEDVKPVQNRARH